MVGYTWRALLGHGREFVTVAQQPTDTVTPPAPAPAPALDSLGVCRQAVVLAHRPESGLQRAESALRRDGAHLRGQRPACPRRVAGDRRQRQVRQQSSCAAESSGAPEAASFSRPNNFAISSTRASTSPCEPVRTMIAAIMARHTRVHLQRHAHLSAKRTRVARAGAGRRAIPGRAVSASLRPDARC